MMWLRDIALGLSLIQCRNKTSDAETEPMIAYGLYLFSDQE